MVNLVNIVRIALLGVARGLLCALVQAAVPALRGMAMGVRIALT